MEWVTLDEVNRLVKGFRQMRGAFKKLRGQGGIKGKMMGRQFDKMKKRQLEEMRRSGVDPRDLGFAP